ncbi:MAG TPA: hypothetical protein VFA07_02815 [Chthonomonadaceae bacterium]|nr:hypothetical protein [Chthonomonadaceae bacterium]
MSRTYTLCVQTDLDGEQALKIVINSMLGYDVPIEDTFISASPRKLDRLWYPIGGPENLLPVAREIPKLAYEYVRQDLGLDASLMLQFGLIAFTDEEEHDKILLFWKGALGLLAQIPGDAVFEDGYSAILFFRKEGKLVVDTSNIPENLLEELLALLPEPYEQKR